ncbi:unnamed protein product, partial [Rotaria magnacalcarata]
NTYKRIRHCKEAAECFIKAIEMARLSNEIDEEYVDMLETDLRTINSSNVKWNLNNIGTSN